MILVINYELPVNNHNKNIMYNNKKYLFPALMQPCYAFLPAASHPVGGMCYAVIKAHIEYAMPMSRFTLIGLK